MDNAIIKGIVDCGLVMAGTVGSVTLSYLAIRWLESIHKDSEEAAEAKRRQEELLRDPTKKNIDAIRKRAEELIRLQSGITEEVQLTDHEAIIANWLLDPREICTTWSDVAGLDEVVAELKAKVLRPVQKKHLIGRSRLLRPPKGVLLHGPPGCGKMLIASAAAKEAGFPFINIQASALMDRWLGEALFTLAAKLQPCIVFIDEIDCLLSKRSSLDSQWIGKFKAIFMSSWDGLRTASADKQVIIMGATNRPEVIDPAFLRRMPLRFQIKLPSRVQREEILKVILQDESVDPSVDLCEIAKETEGFSGSDLKEMCREAAMLCLEDEYLRPIQQPDLRKGITVMRKSNAGIWEHLDLDLD